MQVLVVIAGLCWLHLNITLMRLYPAHIVLALTPLESTPRTDQTIAGLASPSANYHIFTISLYFVRSGNVSGKLLIWDTGYLANYWSSLSSNKVWGNSGMGAYLLFMDDSVVDFAYGPRERWTSFPLRC